MCFNKSEMHETHYRASRFCRVLGNPTAYLIVKCLQVRSMTVKELTDLTGISLTTISMTLRHLRQIEIVRYETIGLQKTYWLKSPVLNSIFDLIENWVDDMRLVLP